MLGTRGGLAKLFLKTIHGIFKDSVHQGRFCITGGEAGASVERLVCKRAISGPPRVARRGRH